jgi:hypothetical protein
MQILEGCTGLAGAELMHRGSIRRLPRMGNSGGSDDVDGPPVPRQEFIQARGGVFADATEYVGQPGAGIDVV